MQTPEGKVKAKVKRLIKDVGAYQHWPVQTGYGSPTLDCIGCSDGRYFAVETKAPGKKLTPRQELTKSEIEDAGGIVFIVDSTCSAGYTSYAELCLWLTPKND